MILSSKGKFFSKINIIDILIILFVLVAIFGAYFRFSANNAVSENKPCVFQYTFTVRGIRESNMKLLQKSANSHTTFVPDGKVDSSVGKLMDIKVEDAIMEVEKTDGTIVAAPTPGKYDVTLTLEVEGYSNKTGYYTDDDFGICAGKQYNFSNIYCLVGGIVNEIVVK